MRSRIPKGGNESMGLRDLEEDWVKGESSGKLRRERGPKDGNSHRSNPLFEGPHSKSFTFALKVLKMDGFQSLLLPLLAKSCLHKEFCILYVVLHLSEISRTG